MNVVTSTFIIHLHSFFITASISNLRYSQLMSKITLLHLSDLHMSAANVPDIRKAIKKLLEDVAFLSDKTGHPPDMILLTGDLISKGENATEEFKLVSNELVEPLLSALKKTQDHLFAVPGNHEVDRTRTSKELELGLSQRLSSVEAFEEYYLEALSEQAGFVALREKLSGYATFSRAYKSQFSVHNSFFFDSYKVPIGKLNVGIVGINSAWRCSEYGNDAGRLVVGQKVINEAVASVGECELKLALCHHPFKMLTEWDEKVVQRSVAREFDMLLTGHIHESDLAHFQQTFGGFYCSTCGSLNGGSNFNYYSFIEIDLGEETVTCHLRKWYPDRAVWDQETEKGPDGVVSFGGFRSNNPDIAERIAMHELREKLIARSRSGPIINPLEGIVQLSLRDVFVEPLIGDTPSFGSESDNAKHYSITELLKGVENLVLFGRPEFGKSLLLGFCETFILTNEALFDDSLPVLLQFDDLPKNNPNGVIHLIRRNLGEHVSEARILRYLERGCMTILLDDFNDVRASDRDKKAAVFAKFYNTFPKCRYVIAATEHLSQTYHTESLKWGPTFTASSYFIRSFNTGKIRQLLIKIDSSKTINIEHMLEQILFYIEQLRIPVTPLAVTLFIGVLFRDRGKKNIQNEAYLVENYLETILEKLNPEDKRGELDFREKESFLAQIAFRMLELGVLKFPVNEFEREKIDYFEQLDEDVPNASVFESFFKNGIMKREDGTVMFKLRFWFDFFIAKAMEKDEVRKQIVLKRSDYLRFSTALAYKAGLSRNDGNLLAEIDSRAANAFKIFSPLVDRSLEAEPIDQTLSGLATKLDDSMRKLNTPAGVDERRDALLKAVQHDESVSETEDADDVGQLLTLHSDILRNTRELPQEDKLRYLENNVDHHVSLMWGWLHAFRTIVSDLEGEELEKMFFKRVVSKKQEFRVKHLMEQSHRYLFQIVPVSVVLYMTEHLGNPKLARSVEKVLSRKTNEVDRVFCVLLLFKLDEQRGLAALTSFIRESRSSVCDYVAFVFLRIYASEHVLEPKRLGALIQMLEEIRKKYQTGNRRLPPHVKDTFRPDFMKTLLFKRESKK